MHKILMIGENAELYDHLRARDILRGCIIETVPTKTIALSQIRNAAFDIVLTSPATTVDHDLTRIDEFHATKPGPKIIILAAEATPQELISALRARAFACFTTPYNAIEVVEMVERALEAKDWQCDIEVLSASDNWIALRVSSRRLTAERLIHFMTGLSADLPTPEREGLLTAFREILLNA